MVVMITRCNHLVHSGEIGVVQRLSELRFRNGLGEGRYGMGAMPGDTGLDDGGRGEGGVAIGNGIERLRFGFFLGDAGEDTSGTTTKQPGAIDNNW